MKNKKQYVFGNSNYRKMNVVTKEEIWFHLEKDKDGDLFCFIADSNDIESCFEKKKAKDKNRCSMITVCFLRCIGRSLIGNVKNFCDKANTESYRYRNIDDFFDVRLLPDREFIGNKLEKDLWLAAIFS